MEERTRFVFPVADWEKIPLEVFKTTHLEVKQYFQSQLEETISVTTKTTQYAIGFLSYLFAVSVFILTKLHPSCFLYILYTFATIDIALAGWIVMGRKGHETGLRSDNILTQDFDDHDNFCDTEKEKLAYLNMIKSNEMKIDDIIKDNGERGIKYNAFLILTIILLFSISIYTLIISRHGFAAS
ncbi:hypothetical protein [Pedobacter sp. GR22-6]|uniref:hypothetical protein n=1 Tax=Pedobacter sp. GR22-6 TaxID=3127957 RepID=UPI00307D8EBF